MHELSDTVGALPFMCSSACTYDAHVIAESAGPAAGEGSRDQAGVCGSLWHSLPTSAPCAAIFQALCDGHAPDA